MITMPFAVQGHTAKRFFGQPGDYTYEDMRFGNPHEFANRNRVYAAAARGGAMVEVGANIGTTTMVASCFFKEVWAFEPCSVNHQFLLRNIELNAALNIRTFQTAVSDQEGEAMLHLFPPNNSGGHSLSEAVVHTKSGLQEKVKVVTLSSALMLMSNCTLLHIDAEGHDLKVLKGATSFMARQVQKPVVILEFAPRLFSLAGSNVADLFQFVNAWDMEIFCDAGNNYAPMSQDVLSQISNLWKNVTYGWMDLFLVPRGKFPEVFPR
jgi:FkbM family methyltransferase